MSTDANDAASGSSPAPLDSRALLTDINAMLRSSAQEHRVLMQSALNELRLEVTGEINALKTEMAERHEYLDGRINRSRTAENELRVAQDGQPARGQVQPLPPGMKMPKLRRIEAKSEKALRQWFRQLDAYLRAYQIDGEDSRAVFYAAQHFDGSLETWWQGRVEEADDSVTGGFKSIRELTEAVFKQFSGRDIQDVARDKLDRVRQTGSVRAYAQLIRDNLVYLPHRSEGDNIHTFKRGLKTSIAQALALRKPTSLAEAIEMALAVEAAQLPTRQAGPDKGRPKDADLNALDEYSTDEEDYLSEDDHSEDGGEDWDDDAVEDASVNNVTSSKPTQEQVQKRRKEGKCLKCGKRGHFARNCPDRKATSGDH